MNSQLPPELQMKVNPEDLKPVGCTKCGWHVFEAAVELRWASPIQCGHPAGQNVPFPVFICKKCRHYHYTIQQPEKRSDDNGG